MQDEIQPELHETEIKCASGATFKVVSTKEELHTDVSSNNHPFFTGERKLMDTTGRVEKFRQKYDLSHLEDREAGAAKDDEDEAADESEESVEESAAAEDSEDDSE